MELISEKKIFPEAGSEKIQHPFFSANWLFLGFYLNSYKNYIVFFKH